MVEHINEIIAFKSLLESGSMFLIMVLEQVRIGT